MTTFQNDDHKQIVLGTLLGNGYICKGRKNAYFCMRHNIDNLFWLQSKAAELEVYASKTPWYQYKTTCTWRSACSPIFNELRDFCYPNGVKTVCMEWLDQLRAEAIAVWYGDSGCLTGRGKKNACLRTQSFGEEGNKIIERYFNEVGISCNMNKSRKSWVIVFTVPGTEILMSKIVAPHLPQNRYFKLICN
jgi:hypothetical protein